MAPDPKPIQDLNAATESATGSSLSATQSLLPALTILAHPDPRRTGERSLLPIPAERSQPSVLSRLEPLFAQPGVAQNQPLTTPYLSRSPLHLYFESESTQALSLRLDQSQTSTKVALEGQRLGEPIVEIPAADLQRGVVLSLSHRIVLMLHLADPLAPRDLPSFGLIGDSDSMLAVRGEIQQLAPLSHSVLIRGETGTGKELVAKALHRASPRSAKPWVALNMAAIPPTLAAAELFGSVKGAFTGATQNRRGAFQQAHQGTLFLDEIGEAPEEIQALLLRTLETGMIQPVGSDRSVSVDVRLITATDLDLESAIPEGRFRAPLLHRIASHEVHLPALRQRREDLGRLFLFFLQEELVDLHGSKTLSPDLDSWPLAEILGELALRPWPGNVRQLRNAARRLAVLGPKAPQAQLARWFHSVGQDTIQAIAGAGSSKEAQRDPPEGTNQAPPSPSQPRDISDSHLMNVLRSCAYRVQDAARKLGISRGAVYQLIDRHPDLRKASDLSREMIAEALDVCESDLDAMVEYLRVSAPALRRQMKQLGFD
ncbi:MAG: sigma 54-interacting transcriptional regulator [Acidobacteriota bacterium]